MLVVAIEDFMIQDPYKYIIESLTIICEHYLKLTMNQLDIVVFTQFPQFLFHDAVGRGFTRNY